MTQVGRRPARATGGAGGTPTPKYVAGKLVFSPATVVDPQRTEGEPLNFLDPKTNDYWESGPLGDDDAELVHPPLDRQRARVPRRQPGRPPARRRPGRRRHRHRRRRPGLPLLRRPRGARQPRHLGLERRRQHLAEEPGSPCRTPRSTASGTRSTTARRPRPPTTRSSSRSTRRAVGTFIYSSPGSTGPTDPVGGLVWQNASAKAPLPLASGRDLRRSSASTRSQAQPLLRLQRGRPRPR